jgi:hypothetical protein
MGSEVSDTPYCFTYDTRCSGRLQILKTSCSISEPTSTTIARIPHEKGERPIRRCHDQSPISARFDGNPTADPCIRTNTRAHCGIRSTASLPKKSSGVSVRSCRYWSGEPTVTSENSPLTPGDIVTAVEFHNRRTEWSVKQCLVRFRILSDGSMQYYGLTDRPRGIWILASA